jgi:hypothetical protein
MYSVVPVLGFFVDLTFYDPLPQWFQFLLLFKKRMRYSEIQWNGIPLSQPLVSVPLSSLVRLIIFWSCTGPSVNPNTPPPSATRSASTAQQTTRGTPGARFVFTRNNINTAGKEPQLWSASLNRYLRRQNAHIKFQNWCNHQGK